MILLDVNVLVSAHREDAERHEDIRTWLEASLQSPSEVAVTELVLSGCLRVITHPKVFKEPTPLLRALEFVDDFRERPEVRVISPGPDHWAIFTKICRSADARGNLVPDAFHAAVALEFGCEWISLDRGFSRFPSLRWRHPLD